MALKKQPVVSCCGCVEFLWCPTGVLHGVGPHETRLEVVRRAKSRHVTQKAMLQLMVGWKKLSNRLSLGFGRKALNKQPQRALKKQPEETGSGGLFKVMMGWKALKKQPQRALKKQP